MYKRLVFSWDGQLAARWLMVALAVGLTPASVASAAVASRIYDFEEGTAGETTEVVEDAVKDPFFESDAGDIWAGGHIWLEVAGGTARRLPPGTLVDVVDEWALADPTLEALDGEAMFQDVSDGTEFDSPAVDSKLALSFDGTGFFDDLELGSRGVYVDRDAYTADAEGDDDNRAESFNLITQGWVYPSSDGEGTAQMVWKAGNEHGSVNITEDGFWEFRDLSGAGDLNPGIAVDFDSWTHLGIRRGGNGAEVFINGEHVDGDYNPTPPNWFGGFATQISLGGRITDDDLLEGFVGMVDDFKVMGTADLAWDPNVDLDFWAADGGGGGCAPINDLAGDLDGDGSVAFADFLVLSANFGKAVDTYSEGDIDCDGEVAFSDFLQMSANFGKSAAGAASVPEPSGMALMLLGGLMLVRRRNA